MNVVPTSHTLIQKRGDSDTSKVGEGIMINLENVMGDNSMYAGRLLLGSTL